MTAKKKKRRNPPDVTMRNVVATRRIVAGLNKRLEWVEQWIKGFRYGFTPEAAVRADECYSKGEKYV